MKLVTYRLSGAEHVGALTADGRGCLLYTSDAADD